MSQKAPSLAERPAAKHCAELLKPSAMPVDLGAEFERFGVRLVPVLRKAIAQSFAEPALHVRALGTRTTAPAGLSQALGPLAACSLYDLGGIERQALIAIEGRAMLEQLDRVLGGTGELGEDDLPAELPVSAALLAQRLAQLLMGAVGGEAEGVDVSPAADEVDLKESPPFAGAIELTLLEFEVGIDEGRAWRLQLAVETDALADLLPRKATNGASGASHKGGLSVAALGDLPLPARATLVDMDISLQRLASLEVGAVLPIIVARSVPLQVGDAIVARGTVGELDDQAALQISTTFSGKDAQ